MPLNSHTYYSLRYGTMATEELLQEYGNKGYDTFALTDINNTSACLDTIRLAEKHKIKPVVGIDFRNNVKQQYVGIAQNNEGFLELNDHLTHHLHSGEDIRSRAPGFNNAFVVYPFGTIPYSSLHENEFVGIRPDQLTRLKFSEWRTKQDKLVILQTATFRNKRDFNAHRLLRTIDNNTLLSKLPIEEQASPNDLLLSKDELYNYYKDFPLIIENTEQLLDNCSIGFEYGTNKNRNCFYESPATDYGRMRQLCQDGLYYRYGKNPSKNVIERMEKELRIISDFGYCSYFLINWDLVRYARSKGYYYVGRGSGANSMVAYLMRITDVDPIELDLYFERFINPHRRHPPDFDIDFSWLDRDDMTEYIFKKYTNRHAALLGSYNTFKLASVTRELGKVFGLPSNEIDQLQRTRNAKNIDSLGKLVLKYSALIRGFPSHLSVHASGILISELPMQTYTATFVPPKGFPTTQFSMLEAEDVGLYKFDILSQRGLGKIKDGLEIIKQNRNVDIDIHDVKKFKEDEVVKDLLRHGKAIGCFYVESPAMRMLLTKLHADSYLGLVAASSIIRPGVAKSGMMREYIIRFRKKEVREKARKELPELYDLLAETYGVMVYQEDVIKVAHIFAGLTLAEADILRRGMSWKFKERNEFHKVEKQFFENCKEKGYDEKKVAEIWYQIETFANFAFSKGHSASYAVESYQALYLKAHYPLEFMVATLNNGGGFYRRELYIHEARLHGAQVEVPCVNNSEALTTIQDKTIYLGFGMVQSLESKSITAMLNERELNGPFKSLRDFMKRVPVELEQIRLLVRANAFRFTGRSSKELLWDVHFIMGNTRSTAPKRELFDVGPKEFKLPELFSQKHENAFTEMELLGFPMCSPFELLEKTPQTKLRSADLKDHIGKEVSIIGYLVHAKSTATSRGESMRFGVFLDLDGQWLDTVHFPPVLKQYPFQGPGSYLITGKVVVEFEFLSIEATRMERIPYINLDQPNARLKPVDQNKNRA